jgi:hypothetical protein
MEYFNGYQTCDAENIDYLLDLNQEDANLLATGPQDLFFEKLDALNEELRFYGIEPIDVTNKWNWKPGSYDKIKEYMLKKLQLDKKAMSLDKIMLRAQDKMNYTTYVRRQASAIEREKANLKNLGVSKDVDVDKFKERCIEFVNKLVENCQKAHELTQGKVLIVPYVNITDRGNSSLYLDVTLKDLTLSVYDGREVATLIQEIPINDIHIVFHMSLRHAINNMHTQVTPNGKYDDGGFQLLHPYISRGRYNSHLYGTVCLDTYFDDVKKAIKQSDMVKLSVLLLQWAQYYNVKISNPYNQPYMSHLGMPKSFSEEYKAINSTSCVTDLCSSRLNSFATNLSFNYLENDDFISKSCDKIDCSFKDSCNRNGAIKRRQKVLDSDFGSQAISMSVMIVDYLFDIHSEEDDASYKITYAIESIIGNEVQSDEGSVKENCIHALIWYYANINKFCSYTYNFLEKNSLINAVKETSNTNNDEMETIMKTWVESQGGM